LTTLPVWRLLVAVNPHVLIVVEKPDEKEGQKWNDWYSFLDNLKSLPQLKEAGERLTDTIWQFPVPSALLSANRFFAMVQKWGLNSKMYYCDSEIRECK